MHCLRRAKYPGLDKVQIQFFMIAMTQNIKRLINEGFGYIFCILRRSKAHQLLIRKTLAIQSEIWLYNMNIQLFRI